MTTDRPHLFPHREWDNGLLALAGVWLVAWAGLPAVALGDPARLSSAAVISAPDPFAACHVTNAQPDREAEPSIAVNPTDPANIVAAWLQGEDVGIVVAASHDGGATWRRSVPTGLTTCSGGDFERTAHPHLVFASDGALYLSSFARRDNNSQGVVAKALVSRSTDGGATWSPPTRPEAEGADYGADFDTIAVEPDTGAVDVVGSSAESAVAAEPSFLYRSPDGGLTWSRSLMHIASPGTNAWNRIVALRAGRLVNVFQEAPLAEFASPTPTAGEIKAIVSDDKGATWSAPVTLGEGVALQWPSAAAAPDGTLYAAWVAPGEGGTCRRFGGPPGGACRVVVARSDDRGASWTLPATVVSWEAPAWLPMPGLAVHGDGSVGVLSTAGGVEGDEVVARTGLSHSHDGGQTWDRDLLGEVFPVAAGDVDVLGLYQELASDDCGFAAAFVQPRAGDAPADVGFQTARPSAAICPELTLRARLSVAVRPSRLVLGRAYTLRFRATSGPGGRPVRRSRISLLGRELHTNRRGRAKARVRIRRAGSYRALATKRGYSRAVARFRVVRPG